MLIEQAFFNLPEVLAGTRYPKLEYESGLVMALTHALLQELNGRNANNPLSYFQIERLYRSGGNFPYTNTKRFLRADLFVNLSQLGIGNKHVRQYGWKHRNWLEAKFFRNSNSNRTHNVAYVLADILRLAILVPEGTNSLPLDDPRYRSSSARYFLHVYDDDPKNYLALSNKKWLKLLVTSGKHTLEIKGLQSLAKSIIEKLGDVTELEVKLEVQNRVIEPIYVEQQPAYYCVLSRLDKIKVERDNVWFEIDLNGSISESKKHAYNEIVGYVAENISLKPVDVKADDDEKVDEEEFLLDIESIEVAEPEWDDPLPPNWIQP